MPMVSAHVSPPIELRARRLKRPVAVADGNHAALQA
jgi:hypothetical protein